MKGHMLSVHNIKIKATQDKNINTKHRMKHNDKPKSFTNPGLAPLGQIKPVMGGNYDLFEVLVLLALHFPLRAKEEIFNSLTSGIPLR